MVLRSRFHPHNDGTFTIQRYDDDIEPALEANKAAQNGPRQTGEMRKIASIPAVIIEKWMAEEGVPLLQLPKHEFNAFIRKKLADPDWAWLRTT